MKEVFDSATLEVQEVLKTAIDKMRKAGAVVDEISVPEHIKGDHWPFNQRICVIF